LPPLFLGAALLRLRSGTGAGLGAFLLPGSGTLG
jgi:hypothetical protein